MAIPKRIQVGEVLSGFPADTHNWIIDQIEELRAIGLGAPQAAAVVASATSRLSVITRNDSGGDVPRFGVLQIAGVADEIEDEEDALRVQGEQAVLGDTPAAGGSVLITQAAASPTAPNQFIDAVLMGLTLARVDIKNEEDTTCGLLAGETGHLESGSGSIAILWKQKQDAEPPSERLGVQLALVLVGGGGGTTEVALFGTLAFAGSIPAAEQFDFQNLDQADQVALSSVNPCLQTGDQVFRLGKSETPASYALVSLGDDVWAIPQKPTDTSECQKVTSDWFSTAKRPSSAGVLVQGKQFQPSGGDPITIIDVDPC